MTNEYKLQAIYYNHCRTYQMMSDGVGKPHPQALIYESDCLQILQSL